MLTSMLIEKTQDYLEKKISLKDFEKWFVPLLPLIFSLPKSFVTDLANTIELGLAEMSDGILSEEQFRATILDFLSIHQINTYGFYPEIPLLNSTTSSKVISLISSEDSWVTQVSLVL